MVGAEAGYFEEVGLLGEEGEVFGEDVLLQLQGGFVDVGFAVEVVAVGPGALVAEAGPDAGEGYVEEEGGAGLGQLVVLKFEAQDPFFELLFLLWIGGFGALKGDVGVDVAVHNDGVAIV